MARYRVKDETDLAWNRIRRQITRDIDTQIQGWREELINKALGEAFAVFASSLEVGTVVQLEDAGSAWVRELIDSNLREKLEAVPDGDVADAK